MKPSFKHKIILAYCIIFYVLMIFKWLNGMFMYQMQPFFFYDRMDVFTWAFMQTHLHEFLLNNKTIQVTADILFYAMPLIYFIAFRINKNVAQVVCVIMILINWSYVECYTLYPTNSIEAHGCWLLFPIIFLPNNAKTFSLLFDGLRYFFLFFFFSSGVWKLVQGGAFNVSELSNILLLQHKEMLSNSPGFRQSKFIFYLINHKFVSYSLYLLSAVFELSFIIGFFTKKADKMLLLLFIIFLIMDYFVMRIPYFEVTPFLLPFIFKNKSNRNFDQ